MTPDNEETSKPTENDHLRHEDVKPAFLTERSLPQRPFFETFYSSLKPSYRNIQEALDAVASLTVTWLGPSGLKRKPVPYLTAS